MPNSSALHRLAFEAVSELIFLLKVEADGAFRCADANPAFLRTMGLSLSQVAGAYIEELLPHDAAQLLADNCREALRLGRGLTYEESVELPSGTLYVETTLQPLWGENGTISQLLGVARDITELKMAERQLHEANDRLLLQSKTDDLTGIANRRGFDEELRNFAEQASLGGTPISIILLDIDAFRPFNDHYGHWHGDECLRRIAAELRLQLQGEWLATRCGGGEFAVLLPRTGLWEATAAAERIRCGIERLGIKHGFSPIAPVVTVSLGVFSTVLPSADQSWELLRGAGQALYEAKSSGMNRVTVKQQG